MLPAAISLYRLRVVVWGHAPQDIFEIAHSETLFPAFLEPNNQFPRQGWPEFSQILFKKDNF